MQNLLRRVNIKQKYLMFCIMLLAIISIIEFFVAFASSAYNVSSPSGASSISFDYITGSGTSAKPYIISDADGMYEFADTVNDGNDFKDKYFVLTSDVTFMEESGDYWPSIGVWYGEGNDNVPFKGKFDGKNHRIYGLYMTNNWQGYNNGLFGYIDGAEIKNVFIGSGEICAEQTSNGCVGAIVGYAKGTIRIENCRNYGARCYSDTTKECVLGGIVGDAKNASGTIIGCVNNAYVGSKRDSSSSYCGGIVGYAGNGLSISECFNTAQIGYNNSNGIGESIAGGICGYGAKSITDCGNTGKVYAQKKIIRPGNGGYSLYNYLNKQYKIGDITIEIQTLEFSIYSSCAGGIVGSSGCTLTNCYSSSNDVDGATYSFSLSYKFIAYDGKAFRRETPSGLYPTSATLLNIRNNTGLGGRYYSNSYTITYEETQNIYGVYYELENGDTYWVDVSGGGGIYYKCRVSFSDGQVNVSSWFEKNGTKYTTHNDYSLNYSAAPSSGLYVVSQNDLKSLDLGSNWVRSASINNGYPHLKRFYWEDNAGLDGADFGG
ncbi:MAG: hypothetical protein J6T74_02070 [Clostridia bacterium]|nr:hypothetical protein [Clostridia bacterium]